MVVDDISLPLTYLFSVGNIFI